MVKKREEAKEFAKRLAQRLGFALSTHEEIDEEQQEAAQRRLAKAVFHSHNSEDQFETALDQHRSMMSELGQAIDSLLKEFRRQWKRYEKKGEHRGYHHKRLAKAKFKRIISLEQRIDGHLRQFEKKLDVLSAWRQHKIRNDIGSEVNLSEVKQFMAEEFDAFEVNETPIEEQEADDIILGEKESSGPAVTEEEEELFDEFVEQEFGKDDEAETASETDAESEFEGLFGGDNSGNGESEEEVEDDEVRSFLEEELN